MRTMAAASLGLVLLACAHASKVEDPSGAPAAAEEQPDAEGQSEEPATGQHAAQAESEGTGVAQKEGRVAGGAEDPSEIPVASSPSGLLKTGAEQTVRDKLGVKAGGSLREALKKVQKEHDLPATGILDQRTVEVMGLDADEIFERASGSEHR